MISVSLKKWVVIGGIDHVKTDWELATDDEFLNIIDSKTTEDVDLNLYQSNYNVPLGVKYFLRAKRYFNNNTDTGWLDTIEIVTNRNEYSRMMLRESIEIDQPILYVNIDEYRDENLSFKVKSSAYRANNSEHLYSHWVVTDYQDNLLFSSLNDDVNLLSIDIPKNINIEDRNNLKIMCVHVSVEGIESKPGVYLLNLEDYNFEIVTDLSNVSPLLDIEIKIAAIDNSKPMLIDKIEIVNVVTKEVVLTPMIVGDKIKVPWYILKIGTVLDIYIYGRDLRASYNTYIKRLTVSKYMKDNYNPEIEYIRTYTDYRKDVDLIIPNFVTSEFIVNDNLLVPIKGSDKVHLIASSGNVLRNTGKIAKGMSLLNTNNIYTYLKRFNGYMVLVDTLDTYGKPMFMVYRYNVHSDDFTLIHSKIRNDEFIPLGKTNAILQISTEKFMYIPVGSNKLMEYDIIENEINELGEIPLQNFTNGFIIRINSDKYMISGGDGYVTTRYSVKEKKFENFISLDNREFIGTEVKTYELMNRDTIVMKTSVDGLNTEAFYYSYKDEKFIYISKPLPTKIDTVFILAANGNLILSNYVDKDLITDIEEHNNYRVFE